MSSGNFATVARAVQLQRTSPNFAQYCVAHVTDPAHRFLFSDADTPDRRQYLRLLDEARVGDSSRAGEPLRDGRGGGAAANRPSVPAAASRHSSPFFEDSPHGDAAPRSGAVDVPWRFTLYDVDHLWQALGEVLAGLRMSAGAGRGGPGMKRPRSGATGAAGVEMPRAKTLAVGPHPPHLFPSKGALRGFLALLLAVAADPAGERVAGFRAHALHRLPQTEAQLFVMAYICEEFLVFAERALAARASPAPARDRQQQNTWVVVRYVEAAATILFLANRLLAAHRAREAPLAAAVAAGGCGGPRRLRIGRSAPVYYQAVFDRYVPRMVAAFSQRVPAVLGLAADRAALLADLREAVVAAHEVAAEWLAERESGGDMATADGTHDIASPTARLEELLAEASLQKSDADDYGNS